MRVLITIPTSGADGNGRLAGIFRYLGEGHPWELRLPSSHQEFTATRLARFLDDDIDGVITSAPFEPKAARLLTRAGIPVLALHDSYRHHCEVGGNFHFVLSDHVAIGRLAARHFLSLGHFASYGYVADTERNRWGKARAIGFERELKTHRIVPHVFTPSLNHNRTLSARPFARWLNALPRPLALFAANDRIAAQVAGVCQGLSLAVPNDVGILGVDNDETVSAAAGIRLSTIEPDFESAGYAAARTLDQLMAGRSRVAKAQLFPPRRLIERDSTRALSPSVRLVEDALAFIDAHASTDIKVTDVADHLKVSRPLLDLRFRQLKRGTVAGAIRRRRLQEVRRLLLETDYTIRQIGGICRFGNELSLKNLFRREFGISMSQYRESSRPKNRYS